MWSLLLCSVNAVLPRGKSISVGLAFVLSLCFDLVSSVFKIFNFGCSPLKVVYFNKSYVCKKHTSNDTRGAIIALYKCGKSQRYIAKQLNIARSKVQLWVS